MTQKNVTNIVCLFPGNLGIRNGMNVGSVLNISFDMGKCIRPNTIARMETNYQ